MDQTLLIVLFIGILLLCFIVWKKLNTCSQTVCTKSKSLDTCVSQKADLQKNVDSLTALKNSLQAQVDSLNSKVLDLTSRRDELQQTLASVQKSLDDCISSVNANPSVVADYKNRINTLNSNITNLQAQIDGLNAQISSLNGKIATLNGKITDLTAQVGSLTANVTTCTNKIGDLQVVGTWVPSPTTDPAEKIISYDDVDITNYASWRVCPGTTFAIINNGGGTYSCNIVGSIGAHYINGTYDATLSTVNGVKTVTVAAKRYQYYTDGSSNGNNTFFDQQPINLVFSLVSNNKVKLDYSIITVHDANRRVRGTKFLVPGKLSPKITNPYATYVGVWNSNGAYWNSTPLVIGIPNGVDVTVKGSNSGSKNFILNGKWEYGTQILYIYAKYYVTWNAVIWSSNGNVYITEDGEGTFQLTRVSECNIPGDADNSLITDACYPKAWSSMNCTNMRSAGDFKWYKDNKYRFIDVIHDMLLWSTLTDSNHRSTCYGNESNYPSQYGDSCKSTSQCVETRSVCTVQHSKCETLDDCKANNNGVACTQK